MRQLLSKSEIDGEGRYGQALYQAKMKVAASQQRCGCGKAFLRRGNMTPVEGLDLHHVMYRESRAKVLEAKLQLLDPRNCRLAHHKCHMDEDWHFQLRNMRLLLLAFGREVLLEYAKGLDIPDRTLDSHVLYAMNTWDEERRCFVSVEDRELSKVGWTFDEATGFYRANIEYAGAMYRPRLLWSKTWQGGGEP